jgi:ribosomal protein S18 acetylase RimI-like enzyme
MLPHVRTANHNDAKLLSELGGKTFYDTFRQYHSEEDMQLYLQKAYNEPLIATNLQNSDIHYALLIDENEEAAGYVKLLLDANNEKLSGKQIELEKIYVLKDKIGSGAGKMLMQYAVDYSRQHGFDVLFLGVWEENERAVNFYKKAGFEVFDTRTFQLGKTLCDDFLMKLELK